MTPTHSHQSTTPATVPPPATLITFSGIDCCGKSTQIKLLESWLRGQGAQPEYRWLRAGYTPLFSALKSGVRSLTGKKLLPQGDTPRRQAFMQGNRRSKLWLTLAILDLGFETAVRVRWLRLMGKTVICDRHLADSEIDFKINFPHHNVANWKLWTLVKRMAAKPDHAFLLDLPVKESLRRSAEKNEPFAEREELRQIREALYREARQHGAWFALDAQRSIDSLHKEVLRKVMSPRIALRVVAMRAGNK
jgi:thymidylate kinase